MILSSVLERYPSLIGCKGSIQEACDAFVACFKNKNKVLICGNGGSAADSEHISAELLKGFCNHRKLSGELRTRLGSELADQLQGSLPAIPLANFTSLVSAYANDCNPTMVYAQLTLGLGQPGDILLAISTSGNAKNVIAAAQVARAKDMKIIALTGQTGGNLKSFSDITICVPETVTYKVQELHLPVYHALCLMVESAIFG